MTPRELHLLRVIWRSMIARCESPSHHAYARYGGRGIAVCDRWHSFEAFIVDMGPREVAGLSLDRVDNERGYIPENCRWATRSQQQRNQSRTRFLELFGDRRPLREWSEATGLSVATIRGRLRSGWSIESALSTPPRLFNPHHPEAFAWRGESRTLRDWSAILGIPYRTLHARRVRGLSADALFARKAV